MNFVATDTRYAAPAVPPPVSPNGVVLTEARHRALCFGFARGCAKWHAGNVRGLTEIGNIVHWLQRHHAAETGRLACLPLLAQAMVEWESCSQGLAIALMRFHAAAQRLAGQAGSGEDAELTRLTAGVAILAGRLRQQPECIDSHIIRDMAAALHLASRIVTREEWPAPHEKSHVADAVAARLARLDRAIARQRS